MSQASLMPRPICFVKNVCGSLQVCKDAIEFLNGINQPVVVVSVVGLYRTGKSYLMNRLAGQQTGFALGNTIESKTKGIWMWCVPHPFEAGQTLVLLDTEGLGDIDKGDSKNDGWIFCLAVLLSSTLVYNSRGTIDNDTIQKLHYITEISEQIKIRSAEAGEEGDEDSQFVRFFPSFVWVVRDFTLSLEIDGNEVTEDEYLDFALQLKKGVNKKTSDYNLPRECIRSYFPSRKCFVFPSPASPDNMKRLENLQERDLVQGFLETTGRFCEFIFHKSPVKTLKGGHRVTGKLLGQLAQIYVETLSSGKVPCLDNAVVALANLENKAAVQEAFKVYKSGMEKVKNNFPVSVTDFTSEHQKFSKLATSEFMKCSFKDDKGDYLKQLVAEAVLNEILNEKEAEGKSILHADEKLTENDRKIQEEKEKTALLEQKCKEEEEKRTESEQMMVVEQERLQDRMKQIEEKVKQEMEQQQEEMERAVESKVKEQEALMNKGFKEKAELMEDEIKNLKKQQDEKSSGGWFKEYVLPIVKTCAEVLPALLQHRFMMKRLKL
ncbi:Guanylate-binding protein 1 [Triplophysa tibetana]|uniref:Guanylate-binding protein 1 n=1 Tax=Triplophysa tibetana TaxID=1572043 RepID=A0A5A9P9W3_9TELE|nr:Guanylate-binding protein 1 [Triplophysa tibetana]